MVPLESPAWFYSGALIIALKHGRIGRHMLLIFYSVDEQQWGNVTLNDRSILFRAKSGMTAREIACEPEFT
jgi:hypothetical protein